LYGLAEHCAAWQRIANQKAADFAGIIMSQSPKHRAYYRNVLKNMVYAAMTR
jgi:hypothetical protein